MEKHRNISWKGLERLIYKNNQDYLIELDSLLNNL